MKARFKYDDTRLQQVASYFNTNKSSIFHIVYVLLTEPSLLV